MKSKLLKTSFLLLLTAADESLLSNLASGFSLTVATERSAPNFVADDVKERPLLEKFSRGINKRVCDSKEGTNRFGQGGAYTSEETIPCLDMQGSTSFDAKTVTMSSRRAIRKAFTESSHLQSSNSCKNENPHGRSSGSGCSIIRLTGSDASSINGLTKYTNRFFERVDNDSCNDDVINTGVFRIENHVYAGFDDNVNGEGKMQFLDTRILPSKHDIDPLLLPMEVGDLVGAESLDDAHEGMNTLLDIGTQITSAVLDMDSLAAGKLIDDGTHIQQQTTRGKNTDQLEPNASMAGDVSNSYHRLIRYLKPQQSSDGAAFQAHVDSSFLTLIPVPELPGLEVWCPSNAYNARINEENTSSSRGEWVRPTILFDVLMEKEHESKDCAYVLVLAGEFLQLTSNGDVPVCIHRVIPPKPANQLDGKQNSKAKKYKPRVSAPMFLRPRKGEDALLDVGQDLTLVDKSTDPQSLAQSSLHTSSSSTSNSTHSGGALYFEEGLLDECDSMHLWSAHEMMMKM
ncbi:hypothetical protein ACHAXR_013585 [Thalassiosira sp. AJA248-18]